MTIKCRFEMFFFFGFVCLIQFVSLILVMFKECLYVVSTVRLVDLFEYTNEHNVRLLVAICTYAVGIDCYSRRSGIGIECFNITT